MSIEIKSLAELAAKGCGTKSSSADDGFKQAVEDAVNDRNSAYNAIYFNQKSFVAISPKFEKKLQQDPELAREIAQKIENMTSGFGNDWKNHMIVIDRSGEITQYRTKPTDREKRLEELEAESLKEAAKARLRKKARLDAYFKIVQQNAIKRKLIEQENAKRPRGKRYRSYGTTLDSIAKSILQKPNRTLEYYF